MKVRLKQFDFEVREHGLIMFQFHEGPIKTKMAAVRTHHSSLFQFHEGPIKTFDFEVREHGLIMFQFHEGPIKTAYGSADASHAAAFQFHEGPIKTWEFRTLGGEKVSFNSMKVRLKPDNQLPYDLVRLGFNSMKVRLKRGGGRTQRELQAEFQFHEGPIKTKVLYVTL